jgi:all-trans-8'-apo-beta-carotenal 15,15'-oxygenase
MMSGCAAHNLPLKMNDFNDQDYRRLPISGLTTSLTEEYGYYAEIDGKIPRELHGTLYRNGPGLFERDGLRKRCILDGDGMIQAFKIFDGHVHFQNKFVRTEKYMEESAAGKFIYATWTTQAPGGVTANFLGGKIKSQAGITAILRNGNLYAFDEFQQPYRLDPYTLQTRGLAWLGMLENPKIISAHSKIDRKTGEWLFFGLEFGAKLILHIVILDKTDQLKRHQTLELPRNVYVHDFFVSDQHIIINLPAVDIDILDYILGRRSVLGSMSWKPEKGNKILVFQRGSNAQPLQLETEPSWMWHSINAYEEGDEIIADFVGYENPDHLLGDNPALIAIMAGRKGQYNYPGEIRRYVINYKKKKIRQEILDEASYEFPFINLQHQCHRYRFAYFAKKNNKEVFFTGIARVDLKNIRSETYEFGPGKFCSEPVFVQIPGYMYSSETGEEPGWLLTEVYDSWKQKTFLAIFRADHISEGPLSQAYLTHPIPLGFHGYWHPNS